MALTKYTYNDALILSDALGDFIGKSIEMISRARKTEHDDLIKLWQGRGEAAIRLKAQVDLDLD